MSDNSNNEWWLLVILAIAVGGVIVFRKNLKRIFSKFFKTEETKEDSVLSHSIYDLVDELKRALYKEGLTKENDIHDLKEKAKQTFLQEVQSILNSNNSNIEKKEKLIELFKNWQENPKIKELFYKVERVLNRFQSELETKKARNLPFFMLLSRYDIAADRASEAVREILHSLIKDGISSARDIIKVKIEFLEKDSDEIVIKERLDGIKQKVEEELNIDIK